jgi:DNA-binding CsgD family transcriptional regulator
VSGEARAISVVCGGGLRVVLIARLRSVNDAAATHDSQAEQPGPNTGTHITIGAVSADWFVGRGGELDLLRGLLVAVKAGVGGAVLVEGEQGIGKTALLRQGLSAAAENCTLAWATADELGQRFPLGLMTECLGGNNSDNSEDGDSNVSSGLIFSGDPVLAGVERLLALADRLCAVRPLVVVAEDLQWADEASVLVWHRLSRAARQAPVLVVGSLRPGPAREDLAQLRRGLESRGGSVVSLGPLDKAEVTDLVGQLVGGRPGQRLVRLAERAGGNPLYARELADALIRGGRVRVGAGVAELAETTGVGVPVSLAGVISARLASLDTAAVSALRWASVLGQEFSVTDLQVVTGLDAGELMGVVQRALAAGLVADTGPRMAFRHGLIRQVLYEGMPAALRSALHLQAARALADVSASPERVAAQLVAVPDTTERWVWDWLAQAAPVLTYRAPQVTADLLDSALAHMPKDDPRRELLEAALVPVAFLLLRDSEVERAGRRVLASTSDPDRAAEITWLVAYTLMRTVRPSDAVVMIEQALARPGTSGMQLARLRALHAMTLAGTGRLDEADQTAREALASAEAIGDGFAAGYALQTLIRSSYFRQDFSELFDRLDQALLITRDDPQTTDLRLLLLMNRFSLLDAMDRRAEALATAQEALALGEKVGTPRLAEIRSSLAAVHFAAGQWDDASAQLETAIAASGPRFHMVQVHAMSALIAGHRDDDALAEHLAEMADMPVREIAWGKPVAEVFLARSLAAERAGQADEALAVLAECLDPSLSEVMPDLYELLPTLTRLAVTAGSGATAAAACAAARTTGQDQEPIRIAADTHCRGLAEADPATVLRAADSYRSCGRPLHQGQALEDAAVLYAARGEIPAARAAFTEAVGLYEALRADWDIRRAAARLRPYGIRRAARSSRRPATGWDALTPAESKVASLVASGQSNPDIAAELFLSRNTVQTHVSHILAKLGAQSRAQIAREVLNHQLSPAPSATGRAS